MINKTIIFFTIYPFDEHYGKKYGFQYLQQRGYTVVILNVFHLLYSDKVDQLPSYDRLEPIYGVEQQRVRTQQELQDVVEAIAGWKIAILVVHPDRRLLRVLRYANVDYVILRHLSQPEPQGLGKLDKVKKVLSEPLFLMRFLKRKAEGILVSFLVAAHPPRFITTLSESTFFPETDTNDTQPICTHSFDYDLFVENKDCKRPDYLPEGDYHVLLTNHPWPIHDYVFLDLKGAIEKGEYAEIINRFLDMVEESTGLPVLVAAYPKATQDENIYKDRPFIYDTEQLVKYSSGVIGHHTGAWNFAVLHERPVCLISLRKLVSDTVFASQNMAYAKALGVPLRPIDTEKDCHILIEDGIFSYSRRHYAEYKRKYLISECAGEKRVWEGIADAFDDVAEQKCHK